MADGKEVASFMRGLAGVKRVVREEKKPEST
jgi:hypothetical protein